MKAMSREGFKDHANNANNLTPEHIFFGCYLSWRSLMWRQTALIQDVCCIRRLILMSTGPQMGRPAGPRGGGFTAGQEEEVEKSAAVCLDKTSGREGRVSLGKNPTAEKKKKKKKESQKMFHALMSLGRRKQSCNPILIAVDLLNRSSRFKSQQITQKAQGDVGRGGRTGLRNQVHLRWYGSSLTRQGWLRGRGWLCQTVLR